MPDTHKSQGSAALGIMASVMFGVLTILSFNNVGQYLLAQSAVEQAARAAARCLTPTDPECVKILAATLGTSNTSKEWYGFLPEVQADKSTTLDLYKYTGSIDRRQSTATYNSYEWHMQEIAAHWDEVSLPTASFDGTLNRYARLYGTVSLPTTITQKELRPLFAPPYVNFPPIPITDDFNNNANLDQVRELQDKYGNIIPWGLVESDPKLASQASMRNADTAYYVIPPNGSKLIVTSEEIRIPTIPNYPCKNYRGELCKDEINQAAILKPNKFIDEQQLIREAHVAIIPTAIIKNKGSSNTTLGWNGLWLDVYDVSGNHLLTYCLGARIAHVFHAQNTIPFNMDIVGPRGSNDGRPGNCEVPKGVGDFSSIRVPRGGSFRIKAALRREDDRVGAKDLLAQVRFLYWFDQYKVIDAPAGAGPNLTCPMMFSTEAGRPYCEELELTKCPGYKPNLIADMNFCKTNWQESWKATGWEPHCSAISHAFYITDKMRAYHSVVGAQGVPICDDKWQPTYQGALNAFSKVCAWNKTKGESLLVGDVVGECPLASRNAKSQYCGKQLYGSVSHKNILEICPTTLSRLNSKEVQENYNYAKRKNAEFGILPTFDIRSFVPVGVDVLSGSWDFKYTDVYYDGNAITNNNQIRAYLTKNPKQASLVDYKKRSGYPEITKDKFFPEIISQNNRQGRWVYGWEDMVKNLHIANQDQRIAIDDVWPFTANTSLVPRPYHKGLERAYVYDYNNDCVLDSECLGLNADYENLKEALRTFASKSAKLNIDLTNPDYDFNWTEEFKEKVQVDPENTDYPECSQYQTSGCAHAKQFSVALGKNSEEPESCKNGTYVNCYSVDRYQADSFSDYQLGTNNEPAKNAALYEMKRLIPFVEDCQSADRAGCAEIQIDSSSEMEVQVNTKINMPISFPLNAVWGDSIVVESNLNSVREIGRLG